MTHMHVAGSIHADATTPAPHWLRLPDDVNALTRQLWSKNASRNAEGELQIAGRTAASIVNEVGSPVYVIDEDDFRTRARQWRDAFAGWAVYYAGKSFLCTGVARWIAEEGLGLDVCTGGELAVALRGGVDPSRIGLHGNNKSADELRAALVAGVGRIIVDSSNEITRLEQLCAELGTVAEVMIRVTTGVEAHTHEYIATAHEDQKFGFSINGGAALVAMVRSHHSPHLHLRGIHSHIGSQIFDTNGFEVAARRTLKLFAQFKEATGVELEDLDLGGGFGIAYTSVDTPSSPEELATGLREHRRTRVPRVRPQRAAHVDRARTGYLRAGRHRHLHGRHREAGGNRGRPVPPLHLRRRGHERQHPSRPVRGRVLGHHGQS